MEKKIKKNNHFDTLLQWSVLVRCRCHSGSHYSQICIEFENLNENPWQ